MHGLPPEDQARGSCRSSSGSAGQYLHVHTLVNMFIGQYVYVHLNDIIDTNGKGNERNNESDKYDFEQAEAEKAKAPPPPPGPLIDRST